MDNIGTTNAASTGSFATFLNFQKPLIVTALLVVAPDKNLKARNDYVKYLTFLLSASSPE